MAATRPGGTPTPTHAEGTLASGLYRQSWTVEDPVGAVVLVHGAHEHGGRYRHVAERLAAAGYATHAVDHPGHGRSPGRRGNIGSMAAAVDGVAELVRSAGGQHPGVPLFVYGHSLGGLIALQYLTGTPDAGVAGAVISAAALDTSAANAVQRALAPLLSRFLPDLGVLQLDAEAVSRDPEVVRHYRTDPLNHNGRMVARTGAELMTTALAMPRRLPSLTLPLLVLHGTADRLVPPAASEVVRAHAGSPDLTVRTYEGSSTSRTTSQSRTTSWPTSSPGSTRTGRRPDRPRPPVEASRRARGDHGYTGATRRADLRRAARGPDRDARHGDSAHHCT